MPIKLMKMFVIAAIVGLAVHPAHAQGDRHKTTGSASVDAGASVNPDVAKALKSAADALGMARWSQVGGGHLPELDGINTMAFWAGGTPYSDYHVSLGYNPPGMRVEATGGTGHSIEVVRDKYAWNESEVGAGLVPGKGTATPEMAAAKRRLLELWTLPYGVVKAGWAAGGKTKVATANGVTVITFPLMDQLAGVTVKATLDSSGLVTKVETQADTPDLVTETDYSDYADRGEIPTDVKFPGHIIRRQQGNTVLDVRVKMADANNPYLIFPVPDNVLRSSAQ
jgi:hypothetical protein